MDNTAGKPLDGAGLAIVNQIVNSRLSSKQPKLTGQPGQVVGFNADGKAQAVQGWSNPNILINADFRKPVNQRGQTEYTANGYIIDQWRKIGGKSVRLSDDWLLIEGVDLSHYINLTQLFDNLDDLRGQTLTAAIMYQFDQSNKSFLFFSRGTSFGTKELAASPGNWAVESITAKIPEDVTSLNITVNASGILKVKAMKVEFGPVQTLAHQDADGSWALNDPPPNKALELAKCQRYYQVFATEALRPTKAVDFRPPMRANPTLGTIEINGVTYYTADANL